MLMEKLSSPAYRVRYLSMISAGSSSPSKRLHCLPRRKQTRNQIEQQRSHNKVICIIKEKHNVSIFGCGSKGGNLVWFWVVVRRARPAEARKRFISSASAKSGSKWLVKITLWVNVADDIYSWSWLSSGRMECVLAALVYLWSIKSLWHNWALKAPAWPGLSVRITNRVIMSVILRVSRLDFYIVLTGSDSIHLRC